MITRRLLSLPGLDGLDIPYFDIEGRGDGPRLTVLAGVHGAEYASIAAVREFVRDLDVSAVSGRIVAVPLLNVPGFWARTPFVVPADGKNLNRSFPGDPHGTFTEVLAHHVFTTFVLGSDYLVDMHAGDLPEALEPFTMFEASPVEEVSLDLALAYGAGHIVRQVAVERTVAGSTAAAAADAGIPAVIAESGQNGLLDRAAVDRHLAGLTNIARSIGVLDGDPWPVRDARRHEGWHWLRTDQAGWWQPAVTVGEAVPAGGLLGTMSDVWGEVFAEVRAPEAGTPLFLTSSPAVSADGLLLGLARD
ncbi:succinylglutamate desuccinylase/aspartoacylase family protein [Planotetraspora kaengkrachanensis]|uniref:Peptidase M14 n=1 Tax=Planotetraspora kaengkrachanensis TaxID=575193 RepID=A0A8J3PXN8_9ACTN|nr:succinylglutamate desuccinylase/aspartoacylase family protein [Planotetraspora kaengkrachanensis]GIG83056.1 peptidase M14 [Planotetraspora kaengkrachanensis]